MAPSSFGHTGDKGFLCLLLHSKDERRIVSSLPPLLLSPDWHTLLRRQEDKAVWVDAASSAQVRSVEDAGERAYQSGALNVGSNAQELAEM